MDKARVEIKGTAAMLMNRFAPNTDNGGKKKEAFFDPEEDAQKALYKDEKIGCYVPSSWIEASMREAAKGFKKRGRGSLKDTILSSVFVDEEKIPLGKKTWDELDQRPAVIQRQRIFKTRPKFNDWKLSFTITFDGGRINKETLKSILIEAGQIKGIGDYRPKFGRFEVVKFG